MYTGRRLLQKTKLMWVTIYNHSKKGGRKISKLFIIG